MSQPAYVPATPGVRVTVSERLPTPDRWRPPRPGEVEPRGGQPRGPLFGVQGPDQGYALKLASIIGPKLVLGPHERREDAVAGCVEVAMRRAAAFGRAPVMPDVELAFAVYGFLDGAPDDLRAFRRPMFEDIAHHYEAVLAVAERVPEDTLRMSPSDVRERLAGGGWRVLLGFEAGERGHSLPNAT